MSPADRQECGQSEFSHVQNHEKRQRSGENNSELPPAQSKATPPAAPATAAERCSCFPGVPAREKETAPEGRETGALHRTQRSPSSAFPIDKHSARQFKSEIHTVLLINCCVSDRMTAENSSPKGLHNPKQWNQARFLSELPYCKNCWIPPATEYRHRIAIEVNFSKRRYQSYCGLSQVKNNCCWFPKPSSTRFSI